MPELSIRIGGRNYLVACQTGEEPFLEAAAALLDGEAHTLLQQIGNLSEAKLLLMSGLVLADKFAAIKDDRTTDSKATALIDGLQAQLTDLTQAHKTERAELQARIDALEAENRELSTHSTDLLPAHAEVFAELTARAEALAAQIDGDKAGG